MAPSEERWERTQCKGYPMAGDAEGKNESKAAETISEDRMAENFTQNDKTHQATDSIITKKHKQDTFKVYYTKTAENQRQSENLKRSRGKTDTFLPKE